MFSTIQRRVLFAFIALASFAGWEIAGSAQEGASPANDGTASEELQDKQKGREVRLRGHESGDGTFLDVEVFRRPDATETLAGLATLDDVRAVPTRDFIQKNQSGGAEGAVSGPGGGGGALGGMAMGDIMSGGMGMPGGGMMGSASPLDARQIAMKKINEFRSKLASPGEDRAKVEEQLRSALSEYFIADLQHRVSELDAVKARVQEMEARLQKRLDLKQEAVDLQLKRMEHEADGLEFVVPNESAAAGGYGDAGGGMGGSGISAPGSFSGGPGELSRAGGYPAGSGGYPGGASIAPPAPDPNSVRR